MEIPFLLLVYLNTHTDSFIREQCTVARFYHRFSFLIIIFTSLHVFPFFLQSNSYCVLPLFPLAAGLLSVVFCRCSHRFSYRGHQYWLRLLNLPLFVIPLTRLGYSNSVASISLFYILPLYKSNLL